MKGTEKKSGMIFQITLLSIFVLLSTLSLLKVKINNTFNITNFYNQRLIEREKFDDLSSIIFFEFKNIDKDILLGKINSLEEYIFLNEKKEEIWKNYIFGEKSFGGYYIKNSSHNLQDISEENQTLIKLNFEKIIKIKNEQNKEYLLIKLETDEILLRCLRKDENIKCFWEEENIKKIRVEGEFIFEKRAREIRSELSGRVSRINK